MAAPGAVLSVPASPKADTFEESAETENTPVATALEGGTIADESAEVETSAAPDETEFSKKPNVSAVLQSLGEVYQSSHLARWAVRFVALALGILAWHWATTVNLNYIINFENVPEPLKVWNAFLVQLAGSEFYIHIMVSMQRILFGYAFAVVIGIGLGLIMGRSKFANDVLMPYVEIFRPIPAVAWIPLAILMWPTEEASIIYITFLGALFPIILNTMHGVEQTPEVLIRAARSLGARRTQIFRHVVLPAALPSIATGLAVGMGVSWFSLLAGEIISGQYGIGYFTWNAYSLINYPDIVVGMLCIGLLGTGSTYAVRLATRPFLRWQERSR
jgi:sulfonate transport system permease protein